MRPLQRESYQFSRLMSDYFFNDKVNLRTCINFNDLSITITVIKLTISQILYKNLTVKCSLKCYQLQRKQHR